MDASRTEVGHLSSVLSCLFCFGVASCLWACTYRIRALRAFACHPKQICLFLEDWGKSMEIAIRTTLRRHARHPLRLLDGGASRSLATKAT